MSEFFVDDRMQKVVNALILNGTRLSGALTREGLMTTLASMEQP